LNHIAQGCESPGYPGKPSPKTLNAEGVESFVKQQAAKWVPWQHATWTKRWLNPETFSNASSLQLPHLRSSASICGQVDKTPDFTGVLERMDRPLSVKMSVRR
jgi:hypothetical protein